MMMKKLSWFAGFMLASAALVAVGEYVFQSSLSYSSTGSLCVTNDNGGQVMVSSIGVAFNTSYPATVTVSRVRGTTTNIIAKYEGQSAVRSVGFRRADLAGYVFAKNDVLTVNDDSSAGTNSTVIVDLEESQR